MDGVFLGFKQQKCCANEDIFWDVLREYLRIASSVIKYDWLGHSFFEWLYEWEKHRTKGWMFMNFPANHVSLRHGMQENNILYIYIHIKPVLNSWFDQSWGVWLPSKRLKSSCVFFIFWGGDVLQEFVVFSSSWCKQKWHRCTWVIFRMASWTIGRRSPSRRGFFSESLVGQAMPCLAMWTYVDLCKMCFEHVSNGRGYIIYITQMSP